MPILMYHSVPADREPRVSGDVPLAEFRRQMTLLVDQGWRLHGVTAALRLRRTDPAARIVAVTFDDGYADLARTVPIVFALGGSCTAYIVTSFADRGTDPRFLGWDEIGELHRRGAEIGSHTAHHRQLDIAPPDIVAAELRDSRRSLEDKLGTNVVSLAYPHGYCSRRVRTITREAGYHSACCVGRQVAVVDRPLALSRLQPRAAMSDASFLRMIDRGEPGIVPYAKRAVAPGWRVARRGAALARGGRR